MTIREEAEKMARDEFCASCKGHAMLEYDDTCTEHCEGFLADVEQMVEDWTLEAGLMTEPKGEQND